MVSEYVFEVSISIDQVCIFRYKNSLSPLYDSYASYVFKCSHFDFFFFSFRWHSQADCCYCFTSCKYSSAFPYNNLFLSNAFKCTRNFNCVSRSVSTTKQKKKMKQQQQQKISFQNSTNQSKRYRRNY